MEVWTILQTVHIIFMLLDMKSESTSMYLCPKITGTVVKNPIICVQTSICQYVNV